MTVSSDKPVSIPKLLTALVVGGMTAILDTTIVAIGLRTLTEELEIPVSTVQWVSTGYLLALAIAIPFVGWAQSRLGGKRLWLLALGTFVAGSLLCACAWDAGSLIAFRVLQGIGGGVMLPLMQTLVVQSVAPAVRTKAMAGVGLPAALGPILGPVLGGVVLHWLSWHWLFLINVPIGIIGLVLALAWLPNDRPDAAARRERLDLPGAALLVPALAGLLYGLSNSHAQGGFSRPDVLVPVLGGAVLLGAFVFWARPRGKDALLDIGLLAHRSMRTSSISLLFVGASLFTGTFLLPLYFQMERGYSVLTAALLLIPQGVGSLLSRFLVAKLVDSFGARMVCVLGSVVVALATLPFAFSTDHTSLFLLGAALFVRGFGLGVVLIPVMTVAYRDVDPSEIPDASAITRVVQQLGGAFGTAVIAVVLTAATARNGIEKGYDDAFVWTIALSVLAAATAAFLPGKDPVEPAHEERREPR